MIRRFRTAIFFTSTLKTTFKYETYVEKSYGALKISKMACSKLVKIFKKQYLFFKVTTRKIFGHKQIFCFYFMLLSQTVLKV